MNRQEFHDRLSSRVHILDGGYGTNFIARGSDGRPGEVLNLERPDIVLAVHRDYVEAGADILLTNTFSANRPKLETLGCAKDLERINRAAVALARQAAEGRALVFGDMSSTGWMLAPLGEASFDDAVAAFSEQARILIDAGVDGLIVETMTDLKELKAAVVGIREVSADVPLIAHMTFEADRRSVTGTPVEVFARAIGDLDVDVLGINCSLGPADLLPVFSELARCTHHRLSVEPNAGRPVFDGEHLHYDTTPEDFAAVAEDFVAAGAGIVGGCCGTSAAHIRVLSRLLRGRRPATRQTAPAAVFCSRTRAVPLLPFAVIGERINPANRRAFADELAAGVLTTLLAEAGAQQREGAHLLDVNFGIEKTLDPAVVVSAVRALDAHDALPLSLDIQTPSLLEKALREVAGRPLLNSARVTDKNLPRRAELLKKYGGLLLLLAMGSEIPETAAGRVAVIEDGLRRLEDAGIARHRVVADALVLSFGAGKDPRVTLETIAELSKLGVATTCGLSNLSFGLPDRARLNAAFLAQAVHFGLTSAICNPGDGLLTGALHGALALRGDQAFSSGDETPADPWVAALLRGDTEGLWAQVEAKLAKGVSPVEVGSGLLAAAMREVGELYGRKKIYLPSLLLAADASRPVFDRLHARLGAAPTYKARVLLATVEGDVHDIGKRIIGTVLQSGGFEVIDLGKDVPAAAIVGAVREHAPHIVGLSAMMTTTVGRIEDVRKALTDAGLSVKLIAGGASMNADLADRFGCDGFAPSASAVVSLCEGLMS